MFQSKCKFFGSSPHVCDFWQSDELHAKLSSIHKKAHNMWDKIFAVRGPRKRTIFTNMYIQISCPKIGKFSHTM